LSALPQSWQNTSRSITSWTSFLYLAGESLIRFMFFVVAVFTKWHQSFLRMKKPLEYQINHTIPVNAVNMMHFYRHLSPFRFALLNSALLAAIRCPFDRCRTFPRPEPQTA
jgi:hypothetical protein